MWGIYLPLFTPLPSAQGRLIDQGELKMFFSQPQKKQKHNQEKKLQKDLPSECLTTRDQRRSPSFWPWRKRHQDISSGIEFFIFPLEMAPSWEVHSWWDIYLWLSPSCSLLGWSWGMAKSNTPASKSWVLPDLLLESELMVSGTVTQSPRAGSSALGKR